MFTGNVDYVPVGCYKDKRSDRALPELLENYRVKTRKYPDVLEWKDLESSVIERCAAKVRFVVGFVSNVDTDHYELLPSVVVHSSQKVIILLLVSLLVRSTLDRAVRVRALAGDIMLCCCRQHTLPSQCPSSSTQWVPANLMQGLTLKWTSIPLRAGGGGEGEKYF